MERSGVLRLGGAGYPAQLAQAPDPAATLYYQGDPGLLRKPAVAIVGSRHPTQLGIEMARTLAVEVAGAGVVVVSGCAIGVDAAAHAGALAVGAGTTAAVLGGGLDVAAPGSNRRLAARIAASGCLLSEYAHGTTPRPHHFPTRNRIIAGLVSIVVVVEAARRSGALITARLALAAGREVMAVPGHPLVPTARGVNDLIADGARPVLNAADVLDELGCPPGPSPPDTAPVPELASALLESLSEIPATAEELVRRSGAALPEVLADLTRLEMLGLARMLPGRRYATSPARIRS